MAIIKVLNLYAGIGGNRKLWKNVDVTAVENNTEIAKIYQDFFPEDKVIVADAHQYLLEHYKDFDFIWSSPPCPSHSRFRMLWKSEGKDIKNKISGESVKFPDMKLYEEIIFLTHFSPKKTKWVVENVISYYKPLIKPFENESHFFWSNFHINFRKRKTRGIRRNDDKNVKKWNFDLTPYEMPLRQKQKLLNNLIEPELGLHILEMAFKKPQTTLNIPKWQ